MSEHRCDCHHPTRNEWRTVGTKRWLSDLDYAERDAITYALDFREVTSPARFMLEDGGEAVGL